jgi:Cu(I)/Ag(I) efflux system membrane fusion protein
VVDNSDGRLKPEMFVSGTVQSRLNGAGYVVSEDTEGEPPLLIPASAPLITGKRAVVYVEVPDDDGIVFEGREVALGPRAGDFYVVKDGLAEGERVVINGAFKIDSELQIQAKPSMMSPKVGSAPADHQRGQQGQTPTSEVVSAKPYTAGSAERLEISSDVLGSLNAVYEAYFDVQMSLAKDDPESATAACEALVQTVAAFDMTLFAGVARTRWMAISSALSKAAKTGQSTKSIVGARDAFFHLSLAALELHDTFGHADGESYYLTYCPMARDNAGAYWLQQENIVWNSFYGEPMLRCGEIKRELHAGGGVTE